MNLKLSKNKINFLTKLIVEYIEKNEEIDYSEDINNIRMRINHIISDELQLFEEIETSCKEKILTQKKNIPEGSREFDILFRKYTNEELQKLSKLWD